MLAAKCMFVFFLVVLLLNIQPTYARGGRGGGGSRGGGSRGGSSGSRGSSSSSSGSRGSSSSGSSGSQGSSSSSNRGQVDYSSSSNNKPGQSKPNVDLTPQVVKPSAPELPRGNPSAPGLPQSPGNSQPSNPQPYNPNFGQPVRPGPAVSQGNQPSYGNAGPAGNPPPYGTNQGNPHGQPPPYSPRENPPPYSPQGNPPPYAPHGVNTGGGVPPPYGSHPSNIPQGGQPPYGVNRPNMQPGNPPPYGVNTGVGSQGYPPSHGGQPPYSPYPRQPGFVYPPAGVGSPNYHVPGAYPGGTDIKPHKKKGLLGGLMSLGQSHKKPKHHGIGGPFGTPSLGGNRISPVHMLLPAAMVGRKAHKPFSHSSSLLWILPFAMMHRGSYHGGYHIDDYNYRGRCFRPRAPADGSIQCEMVSNGILCIATCREGYTFSDNSTTLEAQCWHYSGHWSRSRYFPPCKAHCTTNCENGGTCSTPGVCLCKSEYRGNHCQHRITACDVRSFAVGSKVSWVCSHTRNETLCNIRCRSPFEFESPPADRYHCHINGTWTPNSIPKCIEGRKSTEGIQNTLITTTPKED